MADVNLSQSSYAIAGTIWPGDERGVLPDHAAIIRHRCIVEIVPRKTLPSSMPVIAESGWILPGIINCHVHRCYTPQDRAERFLRHGVTSIGDVGSPLKALPKLTATSPRPTATAACTGPMLCAPGGYPIPIHGQESAFPVVSPEAGRDAVRLLADQGATMIKIAMEPGPHQKQWPMLSSATATAICDQARAMSMIVRCHVENFAGLQPALEAGVHAIEHVPHHWLTPNGPHPLLKKDGSTTRLIPEYERLLQRMVDDSIILIPTLDVLSRTPFNGPKIFEPIRTFHTMGGRIGLGTDYPYRRTDAGMPLREMELLSTAGLSPADILTAGTATSAAACGFIGRGILASGMKADVIISQDDPIKKTNALTNLTHVIKNGLVLN